MSQWTLTLTVFADTVFQYCQVFPASVTSWGRSVEHNRKVGGVPRSAHLAWLAVDVVYDGSSPGPEADVWLGHRGLKRIPEGDHDHLMPRDWNP